MRQWWTIATQAGGLWLERNEFSYAGSLAFYTLFSLASVVILAVAVIGVVFNEEAARGEVVAQLQGLMGSEAAQAVERGVARSRTQESGRPPTWFGVAALIVGATTVFAQMQAALNAICGLVARPQPQPGRSCSPAADTSYRATRRWCCGMSSSRIRPHSRARHLPTARQCAGAVSYEVPPSHRNRLDARGA